ncbi:type II toxin-antitoxin system RelE/ParE family toxin [Pasteurella atlantica]|uniref:Type II toxin-antitoxin system RelE/ParE family toxin n=2 Tax=Pasteurellaceae TaxID=712 RepID=A0ACC6HIU3_9PAST|nr:type II toxin-antitoxin system RelE/ParE family toxin [Pasteurella atlantica]MDP8050817.1 type II toxin-antitoxin system RelE/ParE family toxin [Pasteurella atlantica]MDP8101346.1 type II toxin-antitoxin system RelE/ParE family toxin [Pasteurella atlantica]MDP8104088.1 type II toxin-antitoxin system RelE/ParE family toxin [Pasteurella atlantica]MDP8147473.1 type II toxin-antitoxin system RelE/ParE family toxin [Pasteurella atlantica]
MKKISVRTTPIFDKWLDSLKDFRAVARISARIDRLKMGNLGDHKSVGSGIFELRIPEGKGYRVYFKNYNGVLVILLCGGDKTTQSKDIKQANKIAKELGV